MQAIGQLAGGVAHDFNNLLTAISGHCDLLLLRHCPEDQNYSDLMQINQNANQAAALVAPLLAFSRKQTLRLEHLDIREMLSDFTHLLNRLVGEKVELCLNYDPALRRVRADKRQLEQVLMNLVVNARDSMPQGGQIVISTAETNITAPVSRDRVVVEPGQYVSVTVSDQGCGIAADKLQKIFEPFYTTKRTGEGTGLGLSTVYGIVKQSGGYIFVDSEVAKGTKFTLLLPASAANLPPVLMPVARPPKPTREVRENVILLVEDEATVRTFAARALQLRGFKVIEACSGEEALSTLSDQSLKIDVFVTDVVMLGLDGPSWVKEALADRPNVGVVFVSGYAEDNFQTHQARIPNSVFLPKPFLLEQLTATVSDQIH
jgi:two-component system cell cycle sensor histidine kinase/response regulator CckA